MRILLTGGSGFIGRNILESELATDFEIVAPGHEEVDLLDDTSVRAYLRHSRFDVVIHGAARAGHRAAGAPERVLYENSRMFFNLVRNSELYGRLVILGSGAIYDSRSYARRMAEDYFDTSVPLDQHGLSKYIIGKFVESTPDDIIDLRIFGIFGPYEDYRIRFISNMICKAIFDLPLTMKQNRHFDYLWVKDLIPILRAVIIADSMPYKSMNLTPDSSWYLRDIAELVLRVSRKSLPIIVESEGLGSEYTGANDRLRNFLPSARFTPMEHSIEVLHDWYSSQADHINVTDLKFDR